MMNKWLCLVAAFCSPHIVLSADSNSLQPCYMQNQQNPPSSGLFTHYFDSLTTIPMKCNATRSDLYESKQCSSSECYCVNVQTGQPYKGSYRKASLDLKCNSFDIRVNIAIDTKYLSEERSVIGLASDLQELLSQQLTQQERFPGLVVIRVVSPFLRTDKPTKEDTIFGYFSSFIQVIGPWEDANKLVNNLKSRYLEQMPPLTITVDGRKADIVIKKGYCSILINPTPVSDYAPFAKKPVTVLPQMDENRDSDRAASDGRYSDAYSNRQRDASMDNPGGTGANGAKFWNSWNWPAIKNLLSQPGVLAGVIGAAITLTLLLTLLIIFCIYRLRKRDEGSYTLDESKKICAGPYHQVNAAGGGPSGTTAYARAATREFYA